MTRKPIEEQKPKVFITTILRRVWEEKYLHTYGKLTHTRILTFTNQYPNRIQSKLSTTFREKVPLTWLHEGVVVGFSQGPKGRVPEKDSKSNISKTSTRRHRVTTKLNVRRLLVTSVRGRGRK